VVTSKKDDKLNGQIANTVFQITSEPATLAVSINKNNLTWEYIKASGVFAVSMLCEDTPLSFIGGFGFKSGRDGDKLKEVGYKLGDTGCPLIADNCAAYLEARVSQEMDVGTHTIFIGELVGAEVLNEKVRMTYDYYHQVKRGTTPKAAPTFVEAPKEAAPNLDKYQCEVCGWVYDPELGDEEGEIPAGTAFEDLPDSWTCPVCAAEKSEFKKVA